MKFVPKIGKRYLSAYEPISRHINGGAEEQGVAYTDFDSMPGTSENFFC